MPWQQLMINTTAPHVEFLSDLFTELGAVSITYLDEGDQPLYEPLPGEVLLWESVVVVALFEETANVKLVKEYCVKESSRIKQCEWKILADQVWERAWVSSFQPLCFRNKLWIIPSHIESPKLAPGQLALNWDPGLAFGTGTHPTTALCLEALIECDLVQRSLLDYGCGSGILSVAARLLGADPVYAVDHDPQALIATLANAERNQVALTQVALPSEMIKFPVQVVVANILAEPLIQLAPILQGLCQETIILSGVLKEQGAAVKAAYSAIQFEKERVREGWVCLIGSKIS